MSSARRNLLITWGRNTDSPAGCHTIRTNRRPTSIIPHFYPGCSSFRNLPNLSWLGSGTKYAGLHTQWLGLYTTTTTHVCIAPYSRNAAVLIISILLKHKLMGIGRNSHFFSGVGVHFSGVSRRHLILSGCTLWQPSYQKPAWSVYTFGYSTVFTPVLQTYTQPISQNVVTTFGLKLLECKKLLSLF